MGNPLVGFRVEASLLNAFKDLVGNFGYTHTAYLQAVMALIVRTKVDVLTVSSECVNSEVLTVSSDCVNTGTTSILDDIFPPTPPINPMAEILHRLEALESWKLNQVETLVASVVNAVTTDGIIRSEIKHGASEALEAWAEDNVAPLQKQLVDIQEAIAPLTKRLAYLEDINNNLADRNRELTLRLADSVVSHRDDRLVSLEESVGELQTLLPTLPLTTDESPITVAINSAIATLAAQFDARVTAMADATFGGLELAEKGINTALERTEILAAALETLASGGAVTFAEDATTTIDITKTLDATRGEAAVIEMAAETADITVANADITPTPPRMITVKPKPPTVLQQEMIDEAQLLRAALKGFDVSLLSSDGKKRLAMLKDAQIAAIVNNPDEVWSKFSAEIKFACNKLKNKKPEMKTLFGSLPTEKADIKTVNIVLAAVGLKLTNSAMAGDNQRANRTYKLREITPE
jgi:hypothetical protein